MELRLELIDAPSWMDGLILSREGDKVRIEVRKTSGSDYGYALIDASTLSQMFALFGLTA